MVLGVPPNKENAKYDVVGLGLNAVDYLCVIPRFPRYEEKLRMEDFKRAGGGQVASALVACARWGLKTRYIGKVGSDEMGSFSLSTLEKEGVNIEDVKIVEGALNQFAFILIDKETGERTIVWKRDQRLGMRPEEVRRESITEGRILLVDGHDAPACAVAALYAKEAGIPVVVDAETVKDGTKELIENSTYVVASSEFPYRFTGKQSLDDALREICSMGPRCAVATLGKDGAKALVDGNFISSPGFEVHCVDSTGAGDIFHGAFVYGIRMGWSIEKILDFANAAAALNCTALGARGRIGTVEEIFNLISNGTRRYKFGED